MSHQTQFALAAMKASDIGAIATGEVRQLCRDIEKNLHRGIRANGLIMELGAELAAIDGYYKELLEYAECVAERAIAEGCISAGRDYLDQLENTTHQPAELPF